MRWFLALISPFGHSSPFKATRPGKADEKFETTARILTDAEREKAFEKAVEVFPLYGKYQKKAPREIPVIALERPANTG